MERSSRRSSTPRRVDRSPQPSSTSEGSSQRSRGRARRGTAPQQHRADEETFGRKKRPSRCRGRGQTVRSRSPPWALQKDRVPRMGHGPVQHRVPSARGAKRSTRPLAPARDAGHDGWNLLLVSTWYTLPHARGRRDALRISADKRLGVAANVPSTGIDQHARGFNGASMGVQGLISGAAGLVAFLGKEKTTRSTGAVRPGPRSPGCGSAPSCVFPGSVADQGINAFWAWVRPSSTTLAEAQPAVSGRLKTAPKATATSGPEGPATRGLERGRRPAPRRGDHFSRRRGGHATCADVHPPVERETQIPTTAWIVSVILGLASGGIECSLSERAFSSGARDRLRLLGLSLGGARPRRTRVRRKEPRSPAEDSRIARKTARAAASASSASPLGRKNCTSIDCSEASSISPAARRRGSRRSSFRTEIDVAFFSAPFVARTAPRYASSGPSWTTGGSRLDVAAVFQVGERLLRTRSARAAWCRVPRRP